MLLADVQVSANKITYPMFEKIKQDKNRQLITLYRQHKGYRDLKEKKPGFFYYASTFGTKVNTISIQSKVVNIILQCCHIKGIKFH